MSRRKGKRRIGSWLLGIAALAVAATLWTMPESRRQAYLAEARERAAPVTATLRRLAADATGRLQLALAGPAGGTAAGPGVDGVAAPGDGDGPARGGGDGNGDEDIPRVEIVDGVPTVRLDASAQERSGIATVTAREVTYAPEMPAFGRVVDLQPLLALRARYQAARYGGDITRAALAVSRQEYERFQALYRDDRNIATKRLQRAEADWKRDEAELRRIEAEMRSIREQARQEWGAAVAKLALGGDKGILKRLLEREDVLLLVTLPVGAALPKGTEVVHFARDGNREGARAALYVSPAPYTDPVIQGETYFFRTQSVGLRSDMRVDVWIDRSELRARGVIVPPAAVVWATGQAWAYVKIDPEHFARRAIPTGMEAPGGWFVRDAVRPGERVVVAGAQMLFAEEFRWRIRDEDED